MDILAVRDLETFIKGFHILEGVTFRVETGKLTVILGRNGAGKTTTLKTIMGLIPASGGEILFRGEAIQDRRDFEIPRMGIAYVPEDRDVFSNLTVEENLVLAVRNGRVVEKERLDYIYEIFPPMKAFFKKKGKNLSGGEKQMVSVARALVNDNGLLLIDEPTKGLAPIVVERLRVAIDMLKSRTTVLLVEQNFHFASSIGDHFYIMETGRMVADGDMSELIDNAKLRSTYLEV